MAKECLVDYTGRISQIVEVGEKFEIYEGEGATMKWVTCAQDEVTTLWYMKDGVFIQIDTPPGDKAQRRRVAYGDVGEQLDMMYHDQIESTTTWKDHIAAVKAANPAPDDESGEITYDYTGTMENPAWEA